MSYTRKWSGRRDSDLGKVALYQLSYYRMLLTGIKETLCGRRDSNSYALRHQILSLARLPFRHARAADPASRKVTHWRFELQTP